MDNSAPNNEAQEASGGGWWGFFETVKQKSKVIVDMYTEDLKEFTSTVSEDTKKFVNEVSQNQPVASTVQQKLAAGFSTVKDGLQSLVHSAAEAIAEPGGSSATQPAALAKPTPAPRGEQQHLLEMLQEEPDDADFEKWLTTFNLELKSEEVSRILTNNPQISELYQQLCPATLSPQEFWGRYYFRLEKLQQKENKRKELLAKTRQVEEAFQWDDDDMQTPLSANPPPADSAEIVTTAAETSIAHEPTQTKADEPEEGKLDAAISEPTVIPDIVEEQAAPAKEAEEEAKESVLENIEPTEVVAEQEDATINEPHAAQEPTQPDVEPTPVQETPVSETKQPMSAKLQAPEEDDPFGWE